MATAIQELTQQRLLLQMEYATEKETFHKQTEEMGLQRKVKRGDAWYPLKMGKSYYNSLNQLVVEVHRQGDDNEIEHNFEFGRPVAFFRVDDKDKIKYFPFTGTVSYVDGDRMVVAVPDNGQLIDVQSAEHVGVQLFFDETSYKMMFEALDRVIRAKGRLGYLRDLFYSHQKAETFSFSAMQFPYLNATQEEAVNKVLRAKDVAIVHGPPGTGKTSICRSIAEALGRPYRRVALGGLHDEAEIRGHRRTYVGAMPGRIMQEIIKAGTPNPVFVLDEIDKVQGGNLHGDPSSALLEVLDPEQNCHFHDNFVNIDYDLSKVFFVATANNAAAIPPPLLDRMEVIDFSGYMLEEKLEIANRHLLPKIMHDNVVDRRTMRFPEEVLRMIINDYTREGGVRQLEKQLSKVVRHRVVQLESGEKCKSAVSDDEVRKVLGLPIHNSERRRPESREGVVTGLAWTPVGGEILFIEASLSKGKGTLSMTGNLGDVMKESATLAFEYIKSNASRFGIKQEVLEKSNIHIHVPEGATPKDGPSAGITMFVAMVSVLSHRKVRPEVAMTGEITLRGDVTPIGGVKEKILAAKRAGITDILLCHDNRRDIEEIEPAYLEGLNFHYIGEISEALDLALES